MRAQAMWPATARRRNLAMNKTTTAVAVAIAALAAALPAQAQDSGD
jgi:hypothetical protein